MFYIEAPKKNGNEVYRKRLVKLASTAWTGYNALEDEWRREYYSGLFESVHALNSSRIIQYQDMENVIQHDMAFITILPLEDKFARLHLNGELSQYSFKKDHLKISTRSPSVKTYHYVQSVWMHEKYRKSRDAKLTLKKGIYELLEKQKCGWMGRPYVIYSETTLPPGMKMSVSQGLLPTQLLSVERKPFYLFDSDLDDTRIKKSISNMWGTI